MLGLRLKIRTHGRSPILGTSNWQGPQDVKNRYPSASFFSENRIVFNLGGNKFRLLVLVAYVNGIVLVKQVGTHAEYDKWKF